LNKWIRGAQVALAERKPSKPKKLLELGTPSDQVNSCSRLGLCPIAPIVFKKGTQRGQSCLEASRPCFFLKTKREREKEMPLYSMVGGTAKSPVRK
jgi:hypothetical protein